MRIVILGTAYPYRGGLAAFNERLAREAQTAGDEVEILTFTMQYPDFLFPGKTQYSDDDAPKDLCIRRVMNSINPLSWIRTGRLIHRMRPDLLIIKFWIPLMAPCLGTIARISKRGGSIRVVSVLDNVIPHEPKVWDSLLIRYFIRSVDGFVAMSESVRRDCLRFLSKKQSATKAENSSSTPSSSLSAKSSKQVALCPHPLYDNFGEIVDKMEARRRLDFPLTGKILLFFGFIRDYKGLDLLLRAYKDERLQNEQVHLVVAGEFYGNADKYYALERELNLTQRVIWRTAFIPDEQVRVYFSAADLIVQPYKTATQSGVTQIAYHFCKPMLVTNVGGLAEIVPNGKVGYVTSVDPKAIADALADFCSREDSDCFRTGIEEERKRYSWSRMLQTIKSV